MTLRHKNKQPSSY